MRSGATTPTQDSSMVSTAHFGYPAEFHLASPTYPDECAVGLQKPTLYFQVASVHAFDRHRLEGYAYLTLPTEP
ncbi:unnamed protein product, partial [Chrysoparadoxa australica]